jgi:tRNA A-37 threonylcarbamoyl transferase component Bud32
VSSQVGTLLSGRYRLEEQIGTGGMSTVYVAFDTTLERRVAIKIMHRDIAAHSDQLERFRREARAVAQLSHPHIVGVIDAGEGDDPEQPAPYIVLEYIDGETLKERIRRSEKLPIDEAVAYAIEIARALEAAHDRQIVHRDVKPQNVLIDEEGTAKVTDFGIARTLTEEGLTADGRVLGTTDYVSPEQALGRDVTGQSDLYSLGIVLFEMLTGDIPFHGDNQVSVAMKHVRDELPDVQIRRPEVSSALAAVVDRATAKDLDERYANADEMIADLEDVLSIETARSGHAGTEASAVLRTLPEPKRRRLPLRMRHPVRLVVALALVAVVVVVVLIFAADNTHRGAPIAPVLTSSPPQIKQAQVFSVASDAAHDFDPLGDNHEHPETVSFAIDGNADTAWSTENYLSGDLLKAGVGIYVNTSPAVAAKAMRVLSPTPGYEAAVYGAVAGSPPAGAPGEDPGWVKLASRGDTDPSTPDKQSFKLATKGVAYRHYLLWITQLPAGGHEVKIAEIALYR